MNSLEITSTYVEAMTQANMPAMQALWADDFVLDWVHGDAFVRDLRTRDEMAQFWPEWLHGFPERDFEITRSVIADSVSIVQWIFTGTHTQEIGPPVFETAVPPTNRTIRYRGVSFYDIENGKIRKETTYIDLATLYVELGIEA